MTASPSRRHVLGLLACAGGAALPVAAAAPAAAQLTTPLPGPLPVPGAGGLRAPEGLRLSRFVVNASALRTPFGGGAALVERDLARDLQTVFADLTSSRGATLVARVDSLRVAPWAGGRQGSGDGDGPDNIEGVGIVTAGGRIVSQTPLYTTLDPSYSGPWYAPDIDRLRVASICYQFAYWLRREMGV